MNNPLPIRDLLVPGKRAHLAGIGGVSMCPLAEVLHGMGLQIQGSDMNESDTVEHLRSLGISVAVGHNADNLGDCDLCDPLRRPSMMETRRSPAPLQEASPFMSAPRPGAPLCSTIQMLSASPGPTAKPPPPPCAPIFLWRRRPIPP